MHVYTYVPGTYIVPSILLDVQLSARASFAFGAAGRDAFDVLRCAVLAVLPSILDNMHTYPPRCWQMQPC